MNITMSAILPAKFDDGDFDSWLREFDVCCAANGWKVTETNDGKILKLPAFLRGRAASNFYAISEEDRKTHAIVGKIDATSPLSASKLQNFFPEFELRILTPKEDPSVYKYPFHS